MCPYFAQSWMIVWLVLSTLKIMSSGLYCYWWEVCCQSLPFFCRLSVFFFLIVLKNLFIFHILQFYSVFSCAFIFLYIAQNTQHSSDIRTYLWFCKVLSYFFFKYCLSIPSFFLPELLLDILYSCLTVFKNNYFISLFVYTAFWVNFSVLPFHSLIMCLTMFS